MIKVKPLGDYIVYKANAVKLPSGIIVPGVAETVNSSLLKNIVKAVGPGVKGHIKPGDEIIVISRQRLKLAYPDRKLESDLFIVKEEEVCAIFKE